MNQRNSWRTFLFLGALSLTIAVGAQPPVTEPQRRAEASNAVAQHDRLVDQIRGGHGPLWRRMWLEREGRTTDPLGLRADLWEELHRVPTLAKHLQAFVAIQKERMKLQREREQIARSSERPAAEQLARFHEVLKREDELNTQSIALLSQLKADRRIIEQEVKLRLDQLDEHPAPAEHQATKGEGTPMAKRWRRYYGAVLAQLDRLDEAGNAGEWFGALTRAMWQQERTSQEAIEGALRQLDRLQREQDELRRRLENVQNQLDDLTELLSTLRTKSAAMRESSRESETRDRPRGHGQPRAVRSSPQEPIDTKAN
ncbi:MAG: hypothetical protein ACP5QZ_06285 [Candidatus Sumerlaeaceae bacterium]